MAESDDLPTFVIGVTMAGAISAGAYTAGVLDFLLRALDAHNARAARGPWEDDRDPPRHRVVLRVMSGSSAGGVCAALGLAGLVKAQTPEGRLAKPIEVDREPAPGYRYTYRYTLETLHDVWVAGLDLWRPDTQKGFLSLSDLDGDAKSLQSVLNGEHIDEVAATALSKVRWGEPGKPSGKASFLADELDIFLTTTNLMGVPYQVTFSAGTQVRTGHRMAQHGAVIHFRMTGLGDHDVPSPWLDAWGDDGIPLPLPAPGEALPLDDRNSSWAAFRSASIATGAFPIGLSARLIEAEAQDFARVGEAERSRGGALPIDAHPNSIRRPLPEFGPDMTADTKVRYVAVDGGLINNEPFEYARFTIRKPSGEARRFLAPNAREADEADRAVIMIDPFPEGPEYEAMTEEDAKNGIGLIASATRLFPTLKEQARFKPAELIYAADEDVHSRFLIAPTRDAGPEELGGAGRPARTPMAGAEAIASGGLGGFLGFADESFRMHDFILGQRNCQRFLQTHFLLAGKNKVLGLPEDHPEKASEKVSRRVIDPGPDVDRPISLPAWPRISGDRLSLVLDQAKRRVEAVGDRVLIETSPSALLSFLLRVAWSLRGPVSGAAEYVEKALIKVVAGELVARDQHSAYADLTPEMRLIVVELIKQGGEPVGARDLLAAATRRLAAGQRFGLSAGQVQEELDRLVRLGLAWSPGWSGFGGERLYAHGDKLFRPGVRKTAKIVFGRVGALLPGRS